MLNVHPKFEIAGFVTIFKNVARLHKTLKNASELSFMRII